MADIAKLAKELTGLTVLEVNELKNVLKDEYGIEPAAAAVAVAGPATRTRKQSLPRHAVVLQRWNTWSDAVRSSAASALAVSRGETPTAFRAQ